MGMNKKNVPWQEESEKLNALLSGLRAEEIGVLREFIGQVLEQKEIILEQLDPKKSCIRIEEGDLDFYTRQIDVVEKLLLTDSRIREIAMDCEREWIAVYPARLEHAYAPVKTSDEKHSGLAALNEYFNSFSEALDWFDPDSDVKCNVVIEKSLTLNDADFAFFAENIRQDAPFLQECRDAQFVSRDGTFHCIFVKQTGAESGFLYCKDEKSGRIYSGYIPSMEWFEQGLAEMEVPPAQPKKYVDKDGNPIREGMFLQFDDGSVEEVFACTDASGGEDLGINASNEAYIKRHGTDREYYPLSIFPAGSMEILGQKQEESQTEEEGIGMDLC